MSGALDAKRVVITGGGRGIGAAVARACAVEGARVVVNDIDVACAQEVAEGIVAGGGTAVADGADVSSWEQAAGLIDHCVAEWGGIDGLFNNAGRFVFGTPAELTEGDWRAMVDTNVLGVAFCGTHALAKMTAQGSGAIVNASSGSHLGARSQSAYAATKGAVASLTYSWALDVGRRSGVRVNALSPLASSRMTESINEYYRAHHSDLHVEVDALPEHNAPVVVYLLSDAAAGVHGQVVRIEGTRLSLLTHPAVLHPVLDRDEPWTVQEVQAAFEEDLAHRQQPLGMVGTTGELIEYEVDYNLSND
jgi:NAD(P)-dependent dehydrogenase (short-subunit alcohol dehydrogenase family)